MSATAVWVRFDERPHEWRVVQDRSGHRQLVADILTEPPADSPAWVHGLRTIHLGEPDNETVLIVSVGHDHGAAYFRELDNGTARGWNTHNPDPIPNPPELVFSSQGWNTFPATAVITRDQLDRTITEFLDTGHRPSAVAWRDAEWLQ